MDSILTSTKKMLGIEEVCTDFDVDIITHINSVFMTLNQIGVGPTMGFYIDNESTTWNEYISNPMALRAVRSYMYLKVRLLFDPPQSSAVMDSMNRQANEFEWRLNIIAETIGTEEYEPVTPQVNTIAVLGKALLGSLKLGYTGG